MRVSQSWRQPFPPSHTHTNPHIHTQTLLALQINTSKTQTFVPAVRGKSLATGTNEVPLDSWPPICYCIFSMHSCQLSIGCFAVSGHWFMKKCNEELPYFKTIEINNSYPPSKMQTREGSLCLEVDGLSTSRISLFSSFFSGCCCSFTSVRVLGGVACTYTQDTHGKKIQNNL